MRRTLTTLVVTALLTAAGLAISAPSLNERKEKIKTMETNVSPEALQRKKQSEATLQAEPLETGPGKSCRVNAECWCRNFNGAKFLPGKEESECKDNKCVACLYD